MIITIVFTFLLIAIIYLLKISNFGAKLTNTQYLYRKKSSVMNSSESAFFFELEKQIPSDYHIFPKMRIADILDIPNRHSYFKLRNLALPKHIDFLICDKYFKPLVAIEINGGYHNSLNQRNKDRIKNEMFKNSGLPLETINVGENFAHSIQNIKSLL